MNRSSITASAFWGYFGHKGGREDEIKVTIDLTRLGAALPKPEARSAR
jgi:hypothetical protein